MKITVFGRPISKDNQSRAPSKHGRYFLHREYRDYERNVRAQVENQLSKVVGFKPFINMLRVSMIFFFQDNRHPDLFNAPKSICDALNKVLWIDDKQIVSAGLKMAIDRDNPRVEIEVEEIK